MEKFKDKFEKFGIDGNDDEGIFKEAGVELEIINGEIEKYDKQ